MKSTVRLDEIAVEIANAFDFAFDGTTHFDVPEFDIPEHYNIGLIVGPSGSGKSSILKKIGAERSFEWQDGVAVCSHFESATEAKERLSAVGFNSVPSWLKPFNHLSNGEAFRASLAMAMRDFAVIDEFTSVVDRQVAKSCAHAAQKFIRGRGIKNVTFATCHYDVIDWLQPDWIFDTATKQLTFRGLERRKDIIIQMLPCSAEAWSLFGNHHYLSADINRASRCWIAVWDGVPAGFASALAFPNGNIKNAWRGHRTVVLPEFQGLGIGVRISDAVGEILTAAGCRYFSKTASYRMGEYRNSSSLWKPTSKNMKKRKDYKSGRVTKESNYKAAHADRFCYSHEYIGSGLTSYLF
jgi:GNAT superfamily N-acetyltransferase/ABC-type ATPase involved in cell division